MNKCVKCSKRIWCWQKVSWFYPNSENKEIVHKKCFLKEYKDINKWE